MVFIKKIPQTNSWTVNHLRKRTRKPFHWHYTLQRKRRQKKVEYSFRDFQQTYGVSTYKTTENLPGSIPKGLTRLPKHLKKLLD